jgi:hypothetical protein
MDRKKFIKSALLTGAVGAIAPHILKAETKQNILFRTQNQNVFIE